MILLRISSNAVLTFTEKKKPWTLNLGAFLSNHHNYTYIRLYEGTTEIAGCKT